MSGTLASGRKPVNQLTSQCTTVDVRQLLIAQGVKWLEVAIAGVHYAVEVRPSKKRNAPRLLCPDCRRAVFVLYLVAGQLQCRRCGHLTFPCQRRKPYGAGFLSRLLQSVQRGGTNPAAARLGAV